MNKGQFKDFPVVSGVVLVPQESNPLGDQAGIYADSEGKLVYQDHIWPTLVPIADSFMWADSPDSKYGITTVIRTEQGHSRSVLKFDLSSLTSCKQAFLDLRVITTTGTPAIEAFHLNSEFIESEVTWNNRDDLNAWGTAGGDVGNKVSASPGFVYAPNIFRIDITDYVKDVLNSVVPNRGIILKDANASSLNVWYSREEANESYRPKLTIIT